MSQEQCIDGSRMIVQLVKDMAGRRGITLDEAHWLPDPAQEAPDESSERYTLVFVAGQNLARQSFPRADLEGAPRSHEEEDKSTGERPFRRTRFISARLSTSGS